MYVFISLFCWSWAAYLYGLASSAAIGRDLRVITNISALFMCPTGINFVLVYLEEVRALTSTEKLIKVWTWIVTILLVIPALYDLVGGTIFVGALPATPQISLAPHAGSWLPLILIFDAYGVLVIGYTLFRRVTYATSPIDRKQALVLFIGLTLGSILSATRWAAWYGYEELPVFGGLAVLLIVSSAFYNFRTYRMFDTRIAGSELLVFSMWTFAFFRILVDSTPESTLFDIVFFFIVLFLGATLFEVSVEVTISPSP